MNTAPTQPRWNEARMNGGPLVSGVDIRPVLLVYVDRQLTEPSLGLGVVVLSFASKSVI